MDAFESVVSLVLRLEGYWTIQSLKVALNLEEKRAIGRPSSPRWELDVVAYRGKTNELLVVECKSFLDSPGVTFDGDGLVPRERYKLFSEDKTREVVLNRLVEQLVELGACAPNPTVRLCLAAGKLRHPKRADELSRWFDERGWRFISPDELATKLDDCIGAKYENDVGYVVAKLIGRKRSGPVAL